MNSQAMPLSFDPNINPNFVSQELWIYNDQLSSINEWIMHIKEALMYINDSLFNDWMKIWEGEGEFWGITSTIPIIG